MVKVGTKSLLIGAHHWLWHPLMVFVAWWMLYGFPYDPRLWVAFLVHDWGYWGKANMDGPEGESHVLLGARIMGVFGNDWADLCELHSRHWSAKHGYPPSKLCWADKLACAMTPPWVYVPLALLSGEIHEYRKRNEERENGAYGWTSDEDDSIWMWYRATQRHLLETVRREMYQP